MKLLATLCALCAGLICSIAPSAGAAPRITTGPARTAGTAPATSKVKGLTYKSNVVVIPRKVVNANLIGIAPGPSFKFKRAAGPLKRVRVGRVMLLQGSGAGTVTKVMHTKGRLIVLTRDAPLTSIIKSGNITYSGQPDVSQAFVAPISQPTGTAASAAVSARPAEFVRPGFPYVTDKLARQAGGTFSIQGSAAANGPKSLLGYSLTGEKTGPGELHLTGTICLGYGAICGNGPATGVSLEVGFDGTIDVRKLQGDVNVAGGSLDKLKATYAGFKSAIKMSYTFARGQGDVPGTLPAFHIPLGIDIPVSGPLPFFYRIQIGLLLQLLSKPGKNTVSHGSMDGSLGGGDVTVSGTGSGADKSSSGGDGSGSVSPGNQGTGISLGVLGLTVTTQLKAGIAAGVTVANVLGYTDLTTTVGQEQNSALAGQFCSSYLGVLTWGAGWEAQLGGGKFGLATGKKWQLKQWKYPFSAPPCKPIQG
jgi:hypothetical protein